MGDKTHFKLYPYEDALTYSVIINKNQIEYYMWFELPHDLSKYLSLYEIVEIKSEKDSGVLNFDGKLMRECKKPWIRVETSLLNMEVGYHIYKLSFFDIKINDTVALYFAYRIQTDNPDKSSYVYMKRGDKTNDSNL